MNSRIEIIEQRGGRVTRLTERAHPVTTGSFVLIPYTITYPATATADDAYRSDFGWTPRRARARRIVREYTGYNDGYR